MRSFLFLLCLIILLLVGVILLPKSATGDKVLRSVFSTHDSATNSTDDYFKIPQTIRSQPSISERSAIRPHLARSANDASCYVSEGAVDLVTTTSCTATQSSTSGDAVAGRAIDGDRHVSAPVTRTLDSHSSWWRVDLEQDSIISEIKVHTQENNLSLTRSLVQIIDEDENVVWEHRITNRYLNMFEFSHIEVIGKTVKVVQEETGYERSLSLTEVQVIGVATIVENLALSGSATQSTTMIGGEIRNPWWRVNLEQERNSISKVVVHTHSPENMDGAVVTILDKNDRVVWENEIRTNEISNGMVEFNMGALGASVRVTQVQNYDLALAEVEVFGGCHD